MGDVVFLPFSPRWLGYDDGVRASLYDVRHGVAEAVANVVDATVSAGIFARIVQKSADGLVLGGAVLQSDADDAEQMRDVGDAGAFALLPRVNEDGVVQGLVKSVGQGHLVTSPVKAWCCSDFFNASSPASFRSERAARFWVSAVSLSNLATTAPCSFDDFGNGITSSASLVALKPPCALPETPARMVSQYECVWKNRFTNCGRSSLSLSCTRIK